MSILFSACKKDEEDNTPSTPATLEGGVWDVTHLLYNEEEGYYVGGYPNGTKYIFGEIEVDIIPADSNLSITLEFKNDGTYTTTQTENDTTMYDGYGVWWKQNNTLTIDTNTIWEISRLTSTRLEINSTSIDTLTRPWTGDTVWFTFWHAEYTMDRTTILPTNTNTKQIQTDEKSLFNSFIDKRK